MARPVCKGFCRDRRLISPLQRIRPRRSPPGQDGDTRAPVLINSSASCAVFNIRLPERRLTVRPSRRHPLANTCWPMGGFPTRALNLNAWSMAVAITLGRGTNRPRENSRSKGLIFQGARVGASSPSARHWSGQAIGRSTTRFRPQPRGFGGARSVERGERSAGRIVGD